MVFELFASPEFDAWRADLKDLGAKQRVAARLNRVADGNFGDVKGVGGGVSELRIPYGPGYRVYFCIRGKAVVLLLCGGDKSTQRRDIKLAQRIAADYQE